MGNCKRIQAIALVLDCPIAQVTANSEPIIFNEEGSNSPKFIEHVNGNHYRALLLPANKGVSEVMLEMRQVIDQAAINRNQQRAVVNRGKTPSKMPLSCLLDLSYLLHSD